MLALTDEQQLIVRTVADLAESEFGPEAFSWDGNIPWDNVETLAENGFLGINMSEAYGGEGMSDFMAVLLIDVIGRVCPDTSEFLTTQLMVGPRTIDMFGSEVAKERYLPPVIDGESYIAIAMSEPEAGSDVRSMQTTVEEEGGDLVLNGEKIWVSEVLEADAAVVWVKFPEGLGTVVIEFDWDGVEIGETFTNLTGHEQTQFFMNDVVVPEENVLVRGEAAFKQQLQALNWERLASATQATAITQCAFDRALEYAQDRTQFGQSIADFQGLEWKLADMGTATQAARSLVYTIAQRASTEGTAPDPLETSMAKLYTAETAESVTSEAMQLHGANGFQQGHPAGYLYRFARGYRIAGGTDEIMKNTIAKFLKRDGLPQVV